jgi:hypothetical protein
MANQGSTAAAPGEGRMQLRVGLGNEGAVRL